LLYIRRNKELWYSQQEWQLKNRKVLMTEIKSTFELLVESIIHILHIFTNIYKYCGYFYNRLLELSKSIFSEETDLTVNSFVTQYTSMPY
jgi:hypothetical protein